MKKIAIYFGIILSGVVFNSCESFIDLQPLDKISTNDYWTTSSDLENYIVQFYPNIGGSVMVNESGDSDDMVLQNLSTILNGQRTQATGNWRSEWTIIRNINIFFDNYEKCKDAFDIYKHYVGEAHFFRAWFYCNLLKKYGDVPWYSSAIQIDDEAGLMRPRDSRTVVVDSILADLDNAASYLNARAQAGNLRLNKEAALAFKSRVALYEGSWQKYHASDAFGTPGADPAKYFRQCTAAAEELMNGSYNAGIYTTGNPAADYFDLFGFDNMSNINEVLLYRTFNIADGLSNLTQHYMTQNNTSKAVTWELVSSYLGKDGNIYDYMDAARTVKGNDFLTKIAADCDPRLKSVIWIPGDLRGTTGTYVYFERPGLTEGATQLCQSGFQPKKAANPYSTGAGVASGNSSSQTGYIHLRYAEVLLNYAEAKYELDGTVAYTQLNQLRSRAGMPDFAVRAKNTDLNPIDYGYDIPDALYEIRRERRVELTFECLRDEDLMRWAAHKVFQNKRPKGYPFLQSEFPTYNPPLDTNGLIDYWATFLPNGYRFREKTDYLYSIPQDELTLNPNLKQNPGWND
jgi:hypothetical protein